MESGWGKICDVANRLATVFPTAQPAEQHIQEAGEETYMWLNHIITDCVEALDMLGVLVCCTLNVIFLLNSQSWNKATSSDRGLACQLATSQPPYEKIWAGVNTRRCDA